MFMLETVTCMEWSVPITPGPEKIIPPNHREVKEKVTSQSMDAS